MFQLLYNIRGGGGVVSRNVVQCYIGWGGQNFQFLRYIICTRSQKEGPTYIGTEFETSS